MKAFQICFNILSTLFNNYIKFEYNFNVGMIKAIRFFFCLMLINVYAIGQTKMDTLEATLKNATSDKEKCDIMNDIALFVINKDPDRSGEFANKAKNLAQTIKYKKGEGFADYNLGNLGYYQDDYETGLKRLAEAEKIFIDLKDKKGLGYVNSTRGEIQTVEGAYSDALTSLFAAMKFFDEANDNNGIAWVNINIGLIHYYQKNYAESIKYFNEALKTADEVRTGDASLYLGRVYVDQDNYADAKKHLETASKIGEKNHDNYIISDCLYLLARIDIFYGDKVQAKQKFVKSLEINEELENFQGIAGCCNQLGLLNLGSNEIEEAIVLFRKAFAVADEKGIKEEKKISCLGLSNAFNYRQKYDSAYHYLKLNNKVNEELLGEETSKKLAELEASLAAQKKEAEVEAERKVRAFTQKVIIFSGVGLLLVMIIISYILYSRNKLKQKANQELAAINKEIEHQRDIIEEKHKEITDSINYAERIQRSMLASKRLLDEQLLGEDNYFVFFKPKDVVSGDFYWASNLPNGNFVMVTADSTGHGVPGSIMSMLNMNSLKEAIKTGLTQPADILNYTRNVIISTLANDGSKEGGKDGMDCCCLVYDMKNKKVIFSAANNPVWIVRGTEVLECKSDKMPVGKHDKQDVPFSQQEVDLQKGDVIYAITDGFPDQFGGEHLPNGKQGGKKFMSKRLRELLIENAQFPLKDQMNILDKTFTDWMGTLEQVDDVTIVGVKIR
jgi:serine phosphatase RsbU (regulator of sigma subunit)